MPRYTGQYRIAGRNGKPNTVSVTNGDLEFSDIDEQSYRLGLYQPPLEELPWLGGKEPLDAKSPEDESAEEKKKF